MVKPIVLCILDGVGIRDCADHNAVAMANMPFLIICWKIIRIHVWMPAARRLGCGRHNG